MLLLKSVSSDIKQEIFLRYYDTASCISAKITWCDKAGKVNKAGDLFYKNRKIKNKKN